MGKEETLYDVAFTKDGSPTLFGPNGEKMHSEAGAFGETNFVYGRAVDIVIEMGLKPHFVVVGLGLGYIEMMIGAKFFDQIPTIRSYESDSFLRESFVDWLIGKKNNAGYSKIYDQVLAMTSQKQGLTSEKLKEYLCRLYSSKYFEFRGPLTKASLGDLGVPSAVLYDAYSGHTSPELWEEKFLEGLLKSCSSRPPVFATYSATARLKKVLRRIGYKIQFRQGFAGKRECTLAITDE